jgi:hypothetical protein
VGHDTCMRKRRPPGPHYPRQVEEEIAEYHARLLMVLEASGTYAGSTTEHQRDLRKIILYGVGANPPSSVTTVIAAAPDTVEVVWRPSPYSRAELIEERDRIMDRFPQLNGGRPAKQGTHIRFMTTDETLVDTPNQRAALGSRYPVTIELGEAVF